MLVVAGNQIMYFLCGEGISNNIHKKYQTESTCRLPGGSYRGPKIREYRFGYVDILDYIMVPFFLGKLDYWKYNIISII